MSFRINFLAVAFLMAGAPAAFASPNLVQDGGFDSSTLGQGQTQVLYPNSAKGTGGLTGWVAGSNSNGGILLLDSPGSATDPTVNSHAVFALPATDTQPGGGGNFIQSDGDSTWGATLYQQVSGLTPQATYVLTFDYAGGGQALMYPAPVTTEFWNVSLDTSVLPLTRTSYGAPPADAQQTALLTTPSRGYSAWTTATMYFTATAASEYLSFLAGGTPNGYPPMAFLDNVSLTPLAGVVPEPMTLSLLGTGLVVLAWVARRSRRGAGTAI